MWSLWETELSGSSTARESKGSRDGLGPKIGPGISNTPAPFFTQGPHTGIFFPLEAPIIRQIIIILRKTTNFDRPTGLKMNQPIWHLPELPCGQSTPKGSMQLLLLLHPETYHQAPSPTPSSTLMYKLSLQINRFIMMMYLIDYWLCQTDCGSPTTVLNKYLSDTDYHIQSDCILVLG